MRVKIRMLIRRLLEGRGFINQRSALLRFVMVLDGSCKLNHEIKQECCLRGIDHQPDS